MSAFRALVVDDDDATRLYTCAILETFGFECIEAADGLAALRFASQPLDLIVLELKLTGLDGPDLLGMMSGGAFGRNPPPVIVCSDHLEDEQLGRRSELASAAALLPKPFRLEELTRIIATLVPAA